MAHKADEKAGAVEAADDFFPFAMDDGAEQVYCSFCSCGFSEDAALQRHLRAAAHFQCTACAKDGDASRLFPSPRLLKMHVDLFHASTSAEAAFEKAPQTLGTSKTQLPNGVLLHVLSFLDHGALGLSEAVATNWRALTCTRRGGLLWRDLADALSAQLEHAMAFSADELERHRLQRKVPAHSVSVLQHRARLL